MKALLKIRPLLTLIIFSVFNSFLYAQVGINMTGNDPNSKAMLDISSNTMGLLIPRMTTMERNSFETTLGASETGMIVFDTETSTFYYFDGLVFDSISNGVISILQDADKDTKIEVEETPDADEILFTMAGSASFKMTPERLETPGSNVAIGQKALYNNNNREYLVAIGDSALYNNGTGAIYSIDGSKNTAVGSKALYANTTGYNNSAFGYNTLEENTSGRSNSAFGSGSLSNNNTGVNNAAVGAQTLFANTSGSGNAVCGSFAMQDNTSGSQNTAIGYVCLTNNTIGSSNTAIGFSSLAYNTSGNYNIAIGDQAIYASSDGEENIAIGKYALRNNQYGDNHIAIGSHAMGSSWGESRIIAIGDSALYYNGTGGGMGLSGSRNIAIGESSLLNNLDGHSNTAVGYRTMYQNTSGEYNAAFGSNALNANTTGAHNTAIGASALIDNVDGYGNTAIGRLSLGDNTSGGYNTAIGLWACEYNTTGYENTAIGSGALEYNTIGYGNICLGYQSGDNITSGDRNIVIGHYIDSYSSTANERLNIGNLIFGTGLDGTGSTISTGNIGIGTKSPAYKLDVYGNMQIKSSSSNVLLLIDAAFSSGNSEIQFQEGNNYRGAIGYNTNLNYMYFYEGGNMVLDNGNLGIGTTSPAYRLQVGSAGDGSTARANAWNTFSDASLKKDLSIIEDPIKKVEQVSGYYYYWKEGEDHERQVGIIAQEIEEILPEIVSTDNEGIKSVDYSKLTPLLIEAIKAQQEQIEILESRIETIRKL